MRKLNSINKIFTKTMPSEIDEFWEGVGINRELLKIDRRQLTALGRYLILKTGLAPLFVDVTFV